MIRSAAASGHSSLPEELRVHTSLWLDDLSPVVERYSVTTRAIFQIFQTLSGKSPETPYKKNRSCKDCFL